MPKDYTTSSTNEFLSLLRCNKPTKFMGSLDVESLFTNVPLAETIDIILNYVYRNTQIPPPPIREDLMKDALFLCTTNCPFRTYEGDLYTQIDGVSMGCVLGPTFANFYMGYIEKLVFTTKTSKPYIYCRYVDDIFVASNNNNELSELKQCFENTSVLKFTLDHSINNQFHFLDVNIKSDGTKYHTSVFIKDTNDADYLDYKSICPQRYKIGVIKTLLNRGLTISSSWLEFDLELKRIRQTLVNNNFPFHIIDKTIKQFLTSYMDKRTKLKEEYINLYFCNQMTFNRKQREYKLQKLIKNQIKTTNSNKKVNLNIYYKNLKLKHLILTKKKQKNSVNMMKIT